MRFEILSLLSLLAAEILGFRFYAFVKLDFIKKLPGKMLLVRIIVFLYHWIFFVC